MNNQAIQETNYLKVLVWIMGGIGAILLSFALSFAANLLIPFVISMIVFYAISPLVLLLESKLKFPRWLSIALTLILAVIVFGLVVFVISIMLKSFIEGIDDFKARLPSLADKILLKFEQYNIYISKKTMLAELKALPVFDMVKLIAGQLTNLLSNAAIVFIYVIFLMMGSKFEFNRNDMWAEVNEKIRYYIITKILLSLVTGFLVGAGLYLLGLEYSFMFGVIAFMLNFIPSLGSIVATLIPLPFAFLQHEDLFFVLAVFLIPGTIQFILGSIIEPNILGKGLNIHPVVLLFSLIFWGLIWGIPGAFLAVPITVTLKIAFDYFEGTKKLALLFEGIVPTKQKETK